MDLVGRGHEERLTWSAPPLSVCLSTAFFVAALPRQVRNYFAFRLGNVCGPLHTMTGRITHDSCDKLIIVHQPPVSNQP